MDQSIYWIQKEKVCLNSHVISSFADSWEEQAFAKDAAGPLGGCIWPPRSYTCSFCRREFRSAQALGGHMNVHRRDRARLKQISSTNNNQVVEPDTSLGRCMLQNNNQVVEPDTSLGRCMLQNPNEICNPNFDLDHALFSLSSQRPSTVSVLRPYTCSFGQEQQNSTPMLSRFKFEPRKKFHIPDLGNQEKGCCTQVLESISSPSKKNDHLIEVYLAGNLNPLVRKRCETPIFNDKDDANYSFIFKKRRIDDDPQTFFPKYSNLLNDNETESVIPLKHSPNSMLENLDLELRLGDRP